MDCIGSAQVVTGEVSQRTSLPSTFLAQVADGRVCMWYGEIDELIKDGVTLGRAERLPQCLMQQYRLPIE